MLIVRAGRDSIVDAKSLSYRIPSFHSHRKERPSIEPPWSVVKIKSSLSLFNCRAKYVNISSICSLVAANRISLVPSQSKSKGEDMYWLSLNFKSSPGLVPSDIATQMCSRLYPCSISVLYTAEQSFQYRT